MKKFFSLLLVFILLVGAFPFSARAEESNENTVTFSQDSNDPVKWTISILESGSYEIIKMEYNTSFQPGNYVTMSIPDRYGDYSITSINDTVKLSNFPNLSEIDVINLNSNVSIGKNFLSGLGNRNLDICNVPDTLDASYLVGSPNITVTYESGTQMGWLAGDENNSLYWTSEGSGTSRKLTITTTGEGSFATIPTTFDSNYNLSEVSISGVNAIPADFCNERVKTLTLDPTVTSIGTNAFPGVETIVFTGTVVQWNNISKPSAFPDSGVTLKINCTVTFTPGEHGCLPENMAASQTVIYNNAVPEPADPIPEDGYRFTGWYRIKEGAQPEKWVFSTVITEDTVLLQAGWEELSLQSINTDVVPEGSGSVTVTVSPGEKIVEDKTIKVEFTANPGYEHVSTVVVKHTTNETIDLSDDNTFIMPAQDVDITVNFKAIDYTVTISDSIEGSSVSADKTQNIHVGDTVTLTAVPDQYKKVSSDWGVKDDDGNTINVTVSSTDPKIAIFTMPASNVNIDPVFVDQDKYQILFVNNEARVCIQLDETHKKESKAFAGEQITLTITPPQHKKLSKLEYVEENNNRATITGNTFIMPASDITLEPTFEYLPKLTHIYLNGDLDPAKPFYSVTFYEDETPSRPYTKPTKAADDDYTYTFDKWDEGVTVGNVTTFTPIFKNDPIPRTIEVYAYGEGLVSVDGSDFSTKVTVYAVEGTKLSLKVKPLDNHYFAGFDTAEATGTLTASTFTVGKADARIRATFRENKKVNIKFDANGGTGTMNPVELTSGATYKLPENSFTPPQGKLFFCWQIEDKTFSIGDSVSVKEDDITVKAVWKDSDQISYTVTFLIDSEYQAAVQTVIKGNKAVKPTDPSKDGYLFVGWYTDSGLSESFSFDTPIESNMTLYAKWTPKAPDTDETIAYTVVDGAAQKWSKGTTNTIDIRTKRNIDDNTTLNHFVSLQIDGKALVKGTDYTVSEGSIIVSIKPTTLQNLANGIHRVTFVFDDGKADTTLTILQSTEENSSGGGSSSGGSSSVPKTGDIFSNPVIWFGGMLVVMFILRLFIRARKARIAEAAFMQNEKY